MADFVLTGLKESSSSITFKNILSPKPTIYEKYIISEDHTTSDKKLIKSVNLNRKISTYNPYDNPELFIQFVKIHTDDDILKFVHENGILQQKTMSTAYEEYDFFRSELSLAKKIHRLFNAVIESEYKKSILPIKQLIKLSLNPEFLDPIFGESEPKHKILWENEEFNQTPYMKIEKGVSKYTVPKYPYDYNYNKFDSSYPDHWRILALDIIKRVTYEHLENVNLSTFSLERSTKSSSAWKFTPCFYCPDILTMLYLRFYWMISSNHNSMPCDSCGEIFKPASGKYKYCPDCRNNNAAQMIYYKNNKKNKNKTSK